MVDSVGLAAEPPSMQSDALVMALPIFSRLAKSDSVPLPLEILSRIECIWLVPMRQGAHFPQDSSTQKYM